MHIKKVFHCSVQKRITGETGISDIHNIYHFTKSCMLQSLSDLVQEQFSQRRNFPAKYNKRLIYGTD